MSAEAALARAAFKAQMDAAYASSLQVAATLDAMMQAVGRPQDQMALIAMNLVMDRTMTSLRRINELCDAIRAAHAPAEAVHG